MIHPLISSHGACATTPGLRGNRAWLSRIPVWLPMELAWLPVVSWYVKRLDDGSDEPLGLLALIFAFVLTWRDRNSLQSTTANRITGALFLAGSVLVIGSLPPMLRAALAVAGTGTWFGIHRKPALMGLFVLSLPVIASLQFYAGYPMRLAAAEGAVRFLELSGSVVTRNGVNIELGGASIGVDPACAGVRMLWHSLAAAMALAAIHRVSWRVTLAGGALAFLSVIPANALRAAWLTLEESGRFPASGIGHGNIGMVCFSVVLIPIWLLMSRKARPREVATAPQPPGRVELAILLASALLAPVRMAQAGASGGAAGPAVPPPASFTFNGLTLPLETLPPTAEEAAFAKSFPGCLSSHRWGESQVILRRVTQATRKLHPSSDCLRAAGFQTSDSVTVRCGDGAEWSRFLATRGETRFIVHERIVSEQDGGFWTDVPAWYWSALRHPLNGPWRAETVISR